MLLLRTCDKEGRSRNGHYQYPGVGEVAVAEDWDPRPECGGGLHGLPNGRGDGGLLNWDHDALWQVLDTEGAPMVAFDGKAKCQSAREVYRGDRDGALVYLQERGVTGLLPGEVKDVGDWCEVAVGFGGEATAGNWGTATAGHNGKATTGDRGHATAGHWGTATTGDHGQATTGAYGAATAGYRGHATAGIDGKARAGNRGVIEIAWRDKAADRLRQAVGYVGEDGIEADTWYRCDDNGQLWAVEEEKDVTATNV